jgi:hypothetical protein
VEVDPHDPTTTSKLEAPMQSLNQLPMVTNLAGLQDQPNHEDRFLRAIEERARKRCKQTGVLLEGGVLNSRRRTDCS